MIQEREFVRLNEPTHKIGKTTQPFNKRFGQYPNGSVVKIVKPVNNCHQCEKVIIKIFDKKFTKMNYYGNEYYQGNYLDMEKEFLYIIDNYEKLYIDFFKKKQKIILKENIDVTNILDDIAKGIIKFETNKIRIIIDDDDKLWINAKDLAKTLEYTNTNDAILKHTKKKDRICLINININIKNMKGQLQSVYLSEAGMYNLVTKSKMKKAEIFSDWMTKEVLSLIRKNS